MGHYAQVEALTVCAILGGYGDEVISLGVIIAAKKIHLSIVKKGKNGLSLGNSGTR